MRIGCVALATFLCCALAQAQNEVAPSVLLLARIKLRMAENLDRLPNYTCVETIERSQRIKPSRKFQLRDLLRLEVALVEGKELFAWPGAGKFEEWELGKVFQTGAIANGDFAQHVRAVFLARGPTFEYRGDEVQGGRKTERYDFTVPQYLSGWSIKVGENKAMVGYSGSFWADAESLDLVRLDLRADDLPPILSLDEVRDTLEYARVRIGDAGFLLPATSELVMTYLDGNESRNRIAFNNCRQFAGESVLTFGEAPASSAPGAGVTEVRLPDNLMFEFELATAVDAAKSAIGDPIQATLLRAVKKGDQTVAPKGAILRARLAKVEKMGFARPAYLISLEPVTLEFGNVRARFFARLEAVGPFFGTAGQAKVELGRENAPGRGEFWIMSGQSLALPRGTRMVWRTFPKGTEEKK